MGSPGLPQSEAWMDLGLWEHQQDAVRFAERYLEQVSLVPESQEPPKAALLRMPTGSGKTGVMAVVVNYFETALPALIVVPADNLADQIVRHLMKQFWDDIGYRPAKLRVAKRFKPSSLAAVLEERPDVFVCTTNTLQMLHEVRNDPADRWSAPYATLHERVNLVIVDEGHREPAREWARAVRSFQRPTLLFSATPYRNDFRFFNVGHGEAYSHHFAFHDAVERGVIRNVKFVYPDSPFGDSAASFARQLRHFCDSTAALRKAKVIIRCEDEHSIRKVMGALVRDGEPRRNVIGIHDQFKGDEPPFFEHVPAGHAARYWVHQFKLAEGLDDKQLRVVAFFQPFANARGLVQQIGRVLRNRGGRLGEYAYVFSDRDQRLEERWNGYCGFEETGKKAVVSPTEILKLFTASLPEWFYFDREYRQPAQLVHDDTSSQEERVVTEEELREHVRLPRTAEILCVPPEFGDKQFDELIDESISFYHSRDIDVLFSFRDPDHRCAVFLNWQIGQADVLEMKGFFEMSLKPAVFYRSGPYLFHQGPVSVREVLDETSLTALEPGDLERLLGPSRYITQLRLTNCDLGNTAVRRRSVGARSVADIAPGLGDHFQFVASASGLVPSDQELSVRYIGFSRGRISENVSDRVAIEDYRAWCDGVAQQLGNHRLKAPAVMNRFAQSLAPPQTSAAKHILIDLHEFFEDFHERDEDGQRVDVSALREFEPERFEAAATKVGDDGGFICNIGGKAVYGKVLYDEKKHRFGISSKQLNESFGPSDDRRASASSWLTKHASVRIITAEGHLYADRHFYKPRVPLWGNNRFKALGIFNPTPSLKKVASEKGDRIVDKKGKFQGYKIAGRTWAMSSIFGVIDRTRELWDQVKWKPDVMICDDMGNEAADFVAFGERPQRVVLIHAKVAASESAAADFHVVHSQVVKNLEFFNPGGTKLPAREKRWSEKWQGLLPRIRGRTRMTGDEAFLKVKDLLRDASTEREVWVVVGPGLSIGSLLHELTLDKPAYPTIQLAYLLQSCNATVSSVGARFRLFAPK